MLDDPVGEDGPDLSPEPVEVPEVDPDAPYGRNPKTGKAYRRSPEWRASVAATLAKGRQIRASRGAAPRPPSARKPAGKRPAAAVDYRPGVKGLLQVPAFALGVLGRRDPVYALDSAAVTLHADAIADAVHETAVADERVAAILDRVLAVGPYGALLGALLPLALQIAANHGAVRPSPDLGVLGPDELVAAVTGAR